MSRISPIWLQENWDLIDLNWEILTKEERLAIIDKVWNLPIQEYIEQIMETVSQSIVTIIQAETWSGKTTQVPKMLSQAMWMLRKIIITEPRVIAAIGAARRISKELLSFTEDVNFSIWQKVWYRTWKEKISSTDSEITMVTDGLQLLRQFVSRLNPDILVVDEVHTFSVATEFLLALVKKQMEETKKKIKLVLMSATIDVELMKSFFSEIKDVSKQWVPSLDIPWRTFPVEKHYRWGEDFIPSILELARENKNVLVFVEWKKAIDSTIAELQENLSWYNIVPLHSELPIDEQNAILNTPNKPTIVVATDIAQESITLDYINAVVDNWYHKKLRVRPNGVPELVREPISKADAMQRAWRSWRVMSWIYVWANNNNFEDLDDFPTWEIERITLERYVLISLAIWFDPMKDLKKAWNRKKVFIHNPDRRLLQISYENLRKIWAITWDNKITELWQELLNYPLDPNIAIMLLNGVKRLCAWNMIDICAILNQKSFIWKWDKWKNFVKWTYRQDSDLIGLSEFLKFVTSKEPLSADIVRKLKEEWVDERQLKLYKILSNNSDNKPFNKQDLEKQINWKIDDDLFKIINDNKIHGNKCMLFEIVDLTIIWVKSKKIYEIINKIDTLKERLNEKWVDTKKIEYIESRWNDANIKEKIGKYNETITRNVVRSILSWIMDNIFVWHKKEKKFYNDEMWWFNMPLNTLMKDFSDKFHYVWFPFIIWWTKKDEDSTPLLFFITKVDEWDIAEVKHPFLQESFKGIKFDTKEVWRTKRGKPKLSPRVVANMYRNVWSISLSTLVEEIWVEKLEDVISFHWLPDFLMENNFAIKKYISSFRRKQRFNKSRFKELLTLFTPRLFSRFDMKNIQKTLDAFVHDSSMLDGLLKSDDPRVKEFIQHPYWRKYNNDVIWERQSKKTEEELMLEQRKLIKLLEKHEWVLEDNIELADQGIVLRDAVLWNISGNKKSKTVRKISEKQQKSKEMMEEEIRYIKQESNRLNLTKVEINYYIIQIRKKYKLKEESEWFKGDWYDDRKPMNFTWYQKLEIINNALDCNRDYISFEWLSNYLIENNQSIRKFIDSKKLEWKMFNLDRFKEILTLFFEPLYKIFHFNNIKKSLHSYKFNSSIINCMINSKDSRVIDFIQDPYKDNYNWKIDIENTRLYIHDMSQFQSQVIYDLRDRKKEMLLNIKINWHQEKIDLIDKVYDQVFVREEKEKKERKVIKKKKTNTSRELEILEMREKIRELKVKHKSGQLSKQDLFDQTREIEERYWYKRIIRNRKTTKQSEEQKELSNLQKMNLEIDSLKEEMKPLLKLKKEDWWITKEDLRKMINDIKAKYWMIKTRKRKKQVENEGDREICTTDVEPKKIVKSIRKTKLEFMREAIDNFIQESESNNMSQEEIDAWVEEIELKFWYKKTKAQKATVSNGNESNAIKPIEKRSLNQQIQDLKKESKAKWWTKEKYEEKLTELKKDPKKQNK